MHLSFPLRKLSPGLSWFRDLE